MSAPPLEPSAVLNTLTDAISLGTPLLQTPYDAIAAAVHSIMLGNGCTFVGLGDDESQELDGPSHALPNVWNEHGPNIYTFRYRYSQSNLPIVVKCIKLNNRCVILGLAIGGDKTAVLDIAVEDYTSASVYPFDIRRDEQPIRGFISTSQFTEFMSLFSATIIHRLIPELRPTSSPNDRPPHLQRSSVTSPPYTAPPTITAFNVGQNDLDPLGAHRPLIPRSGDGMLVGPDHPIFGDHGEDPSSGSFYGGPETLPRGSVPPGARFDPIGPFGSMPARGGRGRGRGRGSMGPFSGEPDNDEFLPPGNDNMYM